MPLNRNDILKASDIKTEEIAVPEWGGTVLVRGLTGKERDAFEAGIVGDKLGKGSQINMQNLRAKLVSLACVDDKGARLFTEADIDILGNKSASALERLFDAARHLSGMNQVDIQELTENLNRGPKDATTSA